MMPSCGKILNTIASLQSSLTKTEKKIAQAILAEPELLGQSSLSEVAHQLGVGEATFIRFCRTLGFKGYTDFKLDLAIELATQEKEGSVLLDTDVAESDTPREIAVKLQARLNNAMLETINLLDTPELLRVVAEMQKAKRIFLFGVGSSGLTAEEAKHKFMRIGLQTDAITNNHFMYMQAALLQTDDLVIGLSHSGASVETTKALKIAKESGATTVAITHNLRSPITEVADYVLINGNRQGQMQGGSIGTKIAQLFVVDLLYTLLVRADPEKSIVQKQKTLNVITAQRLK